MASTLSTMLQLGTPAPHFNLPEPATGKNVSLADVSDGKGLLVAFICNHCPYVIHIRSALAELADEYMSRGIRVVAINSNDVEHYAADSPAKMVAEVRQVGYKFPYLYDADQSVAKAYQAACTPDLYVFDADLKLAYRGQFDDSRPNSGVPVTGTDLRAALDAVLEDQSPSADQKPSMGCNIKWIPGNEPNYYG
jgi:peroxiredoxin